jgi:hypothetical protein
MIKEGMHVLSDTKDGDGGRDRIGEGLEGGWRGCFEKSLMLSDDDAGDAYMSYWWQERGFIQPASRLVAG